MLEKRNYKKTIGMAIHKNHELPPQSLSIVIYRSIRFALVFMIAHLLQDVLLIIAKIHSLTANGKTKKNKEI